MYLSYVIITSADDVRSISLPGSYYEKITHLSRSLAGFVRLKHLDLSRNALESLEVRCGGGGGDRGGMWVCVGQSLKFV